MFAWTLLPLKRLRISELLWDLIFSIVVLLTKTNETSNVNWLHLLTRHSCKQNKTLRGAVYMKGNGPTCQSWREEGGPGKPLPTPHSPTPLPPTLSNIVKSRGAKIKDEGACSSVYKVVYKNLSEPPPPRPHPLTHQWLDERDGPISNESELPPRAFLRF